MLQSRYGANHQAPCKMNGFLIGKVEMWSRSDLFLTTLYCVFEVRQAHTSRLTPIAMCTLQLVRPDALSPLLCIWCVLDGASESLISVGVVYITWTIVLRSFVTRVRCLTYPSVHPDAVSTYSYPRAWQFSSSKNTFLSVTSGWRVPLLDRSGTI